ncbi:MAG: soluble lytic murein transglycosylase [Francisellaceae bacterium]
MGQNNKWKTYINHYTKSNKIKLQCWYWTAMYKTEDKNASLKGFSEVWVYKKTLPNSCNEIASVWESSEYDTAEIRFERILLLVNNKQVSLAEELAKRLPKKNHDFVSFWLKARNNPIKYLSKFVIQYSENTYFDSAIVNIMDHYAYSSPFSAAEYWKTFKQKNKLNAKTNNLVRAEIATSLARNHKKSALYWLGSVSNDYADSLLWQWRIRTAVYWADWKNVVKWSEAMPKSLAKKDVWRYWYAVGLWHQNDKEKAKIIWVKLAMIRDYYGFLAADQINAPYAIHSNEKQVDISVQNEIIKSNLVLETKALFMLGKDNVATQYWRWTVLRMPENQALAAANVANKWHKYNLVIYALMASGNSGDLKKRFPVAYFGLIVEAAKKYKVDPIWILSLMRQESHFRVDAGSWVGALGLMQLMPTTAKYIANKYSIPYVSSGSLFTPSVNIDIGVANMEYERHNFKNNMILATAAYNAGEGSVNNWMPLSTMKAQRWVLAVPFLETRHYINNILAYYIIYNTIQFGDKKIRLSQIMMDVKPK